MGMMNQLPSRFTFSFPVEITDSLGEVTQEKCSVSFYAGSEQLAIQKFDFKASLQKEQQEFLKYRF